MSSSLRSTPGPERARYPRHRKLTRGSQIQRVLREGKRARTPYLEVRMLTSLLNYARVGIIVPKHGHSAVERNRLKRQLREITRQDLVRTLPGGLDIVIRSNRDAFGLPFQALQAETTTTVQRLVKQVTGA